MGGGAFPKWSRLRWTVWSGRRRVNIDSIVPGTPTIYLPGA